MRVMKKMGLLLTVITLLAMLRNPALVVAKPVDSLKAAFVRGGDLWIKSGDNEYQLTKGETVEMPKWSADGEWIAYKLGQEGQELRLWHVATGQSRLATRGDIANFQWSPDHNHLAFLIDQKLYWIRADKPGAPVEVAQHIGNFSWLPNGQGFIASSAAELLPEGWTPVSIIEIPLTDTADQNQAKTLFVLPKQSNDFIAVGTSLFKFSPTGKWIAFLATPTASLSADGNNLCVLSADGSKFYPIDQMANNDQWFNWADRDDRLAYIGGVGREATSNKQLKVMNFPATGKLASYTPAGYVDQSFAWEGDQHIVVSRAKEVKPTNGATVATPHPFPALVEIKLQGSRDKPLTQPPKNYGDFNPQYLQREQQLAWVRSDRNKADVLVSGRGGKHPSVWIKNIDLGANFYEQWRWSDVLSFYS